MKDAMPSSKLLRPAVAAFALLAACGEGATDAEPGTLTRADAVALAPTYAELAEEALATLGSPSYDAAADGVVSAAPVTTTTTFTRTRACPISGSVRVEGTMEMTVDREARTASMAYDAVRTEQSCAFPLRSGGTLTITGNPHTTVTGSWSMAHGSPGTRTLRQQGSFTWLHSSGATGTCDVDLTATWSAATRTHRVQGTFCGRAVDVSRTRG